MKRTSSQASEETDDRLIEAAVDPPPSSSSQTQTHSQTTTTTNNLVEQPKTNNRHPHPHKRYQRAYHHSHPQSIMPSSPPIEHPSSSPPDFQPSIQSILSITKIPFNPLQPSKPSPRVHPTHQAHLHKLISAIDHLLSDPPTPTSDSLTTLAGFCQVIVLGRSKLVDTLYDGLKDRLELRANQLRLSLIDGFPNDPILHSLLSSDPTLDLPSLIAIIDRSSTQLWILKLVHHWRTWYDQLLLIRSMLIHLDRFLRTRPSQATLPIWELGLDLFRTIVIGRPWNPISLSLSIVISHQITLERSGQSTLLSTLQSLIQLFYTAFRTNGFTTLISLPLNQITESFYRAEGIRLVHDIQASVLTVGGPNGYLTHINRRIESEIELFAKVFTTPDRKLNQQLLKSVIRSIESNLILAHLDVLLELGLVKLLENYPEPNSSQSLRDFYKLTLRLGDRPTRQLGVCFSNWIKRTGTKLVEESHELSPEQEVSLQSKSDAGMICRLIEFKSKLDQVVLHCFSEDREMFYAIKEAFEFFINQRQNKPAELLAKFLDQKMRLGSKTMNESEMEECLNQILTLFRYTQGKDIFEEFYKRDLARRLLLLKSACSIDFERNMIMKLKNECGPGFTAKLEVMFRDIETSKDLNEAYEDHLKKELEAKPGEEDATQDHHVIDLNVSILTAGSWPTNVSSSIDVNKQVILPTELQSKLERFESFYHSKHLGRRLTWSHSLGQIVLSANFSNPSHNPVSHQRNASKKELSVSTHQALILLLFNDDLDDQSIDFESIAQRTGIDEKTLARTLQSLACGKFRVLLKEPRSKEVSRGDTFLFNSNFKHDHFRIKINQIQAKETVEERSSTREKVVTERSTLIQLTIVRIMKSRKKAKFNELVQDLHEQINGRFKFEVKEIKTAIESLIARDYLERLGIDQFQYLA